MNLPVIVEQIEVPRTNAQLQTIPIMLIDEMIVRILSAYTKGPIMADKISTGKRLLVKNFCTLYGNSNIALWRISLLSDEKAYEIMCYRNAVQVH